MSVVINHMGHFNHESILDEKAVVIHALILRPLERIGAQVRESKAFGVPCERAF